MKKIINIVLYTVPMAAFLTFVSCKDNAEAENPDANEPITVKVDTLNPVGSDGMGREVDTVNSIARDANNPVNDYEVRP